MFAPCFMTGALLIGDNSDYSFPIGIEFYMIPDKYTKNKLHSVYYLLWKFVP